MGRKRKQQRVQNEDAPKIKEAPLKVENGFAEAVGFGSGFGRGGGFPGGFGYQQVEDSTTLFENLRWDMVSNFRQLLSQLFVEIGLVQTICRVPVEDGLRGGVMFKSKQLDEDEIKKLQIEMDRNDDLGTAGWAATWNRLYGGAGVLTIVEDQDPEFPLDLKAITKDTQVDFRAVDMWELFWDKQNTEGYDPQIQAQEFEFYDYYAENVHKSRVMRMKGIEAPSFIRPRLRGWGVSVVEALVRSMNQYLKATDLGFEVLDEFKLDVYKIKNMVNTLLSPNGTAKIKERIQLANWQKNFQHALVMDSEDDFDHKQLSFAGLGDAMAGIRMQVAADMRTPIIKLFGQSVSAGLGNSAQDEMENYNSMVESEIRGKLKYHILLMAQIRCQQLFGMIPDDLELEFKPLRELTAVDQENVKTQKFQRILQAQQAGALSDEEFKDACNKGNLFDIQLDKTQNMLNPDNPDVADDEGGAENNDSLDTEDTGSDREDSRNPEITSDQKPQYPPKTVKNRGGFQEGDHPRDDYGMFTGDGAISKIHEADKEQALSTISGKIKDKDWDKFVEAYDKALDSAQLGFVSPNAAKKIRTSHKFTFESDPDNESMHKHTKEKRGKSVTDPSIVLRFGDEYIAIDGQHRLNRAIKDGENARVAIVDGSLLEEFGITRASFEGKKSFANDIFTWSDWDLVKRFFNSPAFDRASYEADGGDSWIHPGRKEIFSNPMNIDESLWSRAKAASRAALGEERWQFVVWWYQKQGGKF